VLVPSLCGPSQQFSIGWRVEVMITFCLAGAATCNNKVQKLKLYGNAVDKTGRPADDMFVFGGNDSKWKVSLGYSGFDAYFVPSTKLSIGSFVALACKSSNL
jgi:hypothetical protein